MKRMNYVKKALSFCVTLVLLMTFSVEAGALSLSDFGVETNRPSSSSNNSIKNGGFESTSDGQWNTDTFLKDGLLYVTSDPTAPEGDKVLCYKNTSATPSWRKFTVSGLSKNQTYIFSVWVKTPYLSATNKAKASIGVMDPDAGKDAFAKMTDSYLGHVSWDTEQIRSTATDNKWHLRSVQFKASSSSVTIGIYGYSSEMYFDDMALHRTNSFLSTKSKAYKGERLTTSLTAANSGDNKYCADEKNLIPDANMIGDRSTEFWTKTSSGWNNGFMSFDKVGGDQGRVMKYSSVNPIGLHYFKWLKVEPNTTYTLTFKYKVTKTGNGSIKLVDDNIELPKAFRTISFNSKTDWQVTSIKFDSKVFKQVGFVIQDKGGEVLLDDFRLFKSGDGISTEPEAEIIPTLKPIHTGVSISDSAEQNDLPETQRQYKLAFRMEVPVEGLSIAESYMLDYTNATVDALSDGNVYPLVSMGALICNSADRASPEHMVIDRVDGSRMVNAVAEKGISVAKGKAEYAVRIINIPFAHTESNIYVRPYYVFRHKGKDICVYGDIIKSCYQEVFVDSNGRSDWN